MPTIDRAGWAAIAIVLFGVLLVGANILSVRFNAS